MAILDASEEPKSPLPLTQHATTLWMAAVLEQIIIEQFRGRPDDFGKFTMACLGPLEAIGDDYSDSGAQKQVSAMALRRCEVFLRGLQQSVEGSRTE